MEIQRNQTEMQLYRQQSTRNLTEEEKTRIILSLTLQNQIFEYEK